MGSKESLAENDLCFCDIEQTETDSICTGAGVVKPTCNAYESPLEVTTQSSKFQDFNRRQFRDYEQSYSFQNIQVFGERYYADLFPGHSNQARLKLNVPDWCNIDTAVESVDYTNCLYLPSRAVAAADVNIAIEFKSDYEFLIPGASTVTIETYVTETPTPTLSNCESYLVNTDGTDAEKMIRPYNLNWETTSCDDFGNVTRRPYAGSDDETDSKYIDTGLFTKNNRLLFATEVRNCSLEREVYSGLDTSTETVTSEVYNWKDNTVEDRSGSISVPVEFEGLQILKCQVGVFTSTIDQRKYPDPLQTFEVVHEFEGGVPFQQHFTPTAAIVDVRAVAGSAVDACNKLNNEENTGWMPIHKSFYYDPCNSILTRSNTHELAFRADDIVSKHLDIGPDQTCVLERKYLPDVQYTELGIGECVPGSALSEGPGRLSRNHRLYNADPAKECAQRCFEEFESHAFTLKVSTVIPEWISAPSDAFHSNTFQQYTGANFFQKFTSMSLLFDSMPIPELLNECYCAADTCTSLDSQVEIWNQATNNTCFGEFFTAVFNQQTQKKANEFINAHWGSKCEIDGEFDRTFYKSYSLYTSLSIHANHYTELVPYSLADLTTGLNLTKIDHRGAVAGTSHASENACGPLNPCPKCAGDCNEDSDCESELKCFHRTYGEQVPGCDFGGPAETEFCYDPSEANEVDAIAGLDELASDGVTKAQICIKKIPWCPVISETTKVQDITENAYECSCYTEAKHVFSNHQRPYWVYEHHKIMKNERKYCLQELDTKKIIVDKMPCKAFNKTVPWVTGFDTSSLNDFPVENLQECFCGGDNGLYCSDTEFCVGDDHERVCQTMAQMVDKDIPVNVVDHGSCSDLPGWTPVFDAMVCHGQRTLLLQEHGTEYSSSDVGRMAQVSYEEIGSYYSSEYHGKENYNHFRMYGGCGSAASPTNTYPDGTDICSATDDMKVYECARACYAFGSPNGVAAKGFLMSSTGRCYCSAVLTDSGTAAGVGGAYTGYDFTDTKNAGRINLETDVEYVRLGDLQSNPVNELYGGIEFPEGCTLSWVSEIEGTVPFYTNTHLLESNANHDQYKDTWGEGCAIPSLASWYEGASEYSSAYYSCDSPRRYDNWKEFFVRTNRFGTTRALPKLSEDGVNHPLGLYARFGSEDVPVATKTLQVNTKHVENLEFSQLDNIPAEIYNIKYMQRKMCQLDRPRCDDVVSGEGYDRKYCIQTISKPSLNNVGDPTSALGTLGNCEGDCDKDEHCAGDLKCFHRSSGGPVPGCEGTYPEHISWDFCYDPDYVDTQTIVDMGTTPIDENVKACTHDRRPMDENGPLKLCQCHNTELCSSKHTPFCLDNGACVKNGKCLHKGQMLAQCEGGPGWLQPIGDGDEVDQNKCENWFDSNEMDTTRPRANGKCGTIKCPRGQVYDSFLNACGSNSSTFSLVAKLTSGTCSDIGATNGNNSESCESYNIGRTSKYISFEPVMSVDAPYGCSMVVSDTDDRSKVSNGLFNIYDSRQTCSQKTPCLCVVADMPSCESNVVTQEPCLCGQERDIMSVGGMCVHNQPYHVCTDDNQDFRMNWDCVCNGEIVRSGTFCFDDGAFTENTAFSKHGVGFQPKRPTCHPQYVEVSVHMPDILSSDYLQLPNSRNKDSGFIRLPGTESMETPTPSSVINDLNYLAKSIFSKNASLRLGSHIEPFAGVFNSDGLFCNNNTCFFGVGAKYVPKLVMPDSTCGGNNVNNQNITSVDDCATACGKAKGCKLFSYSVQDNVCRLESYDNKKSCQNRKDLRYSLYEYELDWAEEDSPCQNSWGKTCHSWLNIVDTYYNNIRLGDPLNTFSDPVSYDAKGLYHIEDETATTYYIGRFGNRRCADDKKLTCGISKIKHPKRKIDEKPMTYKVDTSAYSEPAPESTYSEPAPVSTYSEPAPVSTYSEPTYTNNYY